MPCMSLEGLAIANLWGVCNMQAEPDGVPCQGGSETLQTASDAQHNILRILGSKAATLEGARRESRCGPVQNARLHALNLRSEYRRHSCILHATYR